MKRLDAAISDFFKLTRSDARSTVKSGIVTVNGTVVRDCGKQLSESDIVLCRGENVSVCEKPVYIMLNKPIGVVSTTSADENNVIGLLPEKYRNGELFPVGRLDKDTRGLLIITSDGAFCHRLTSPKKQTEKVYEAVVSSPVKPEYVELFSKGLVLRDGLQTLPAKLEINENDPCRCAVTVCEGKYHQVRRMLASVGCTVTDLRRTRIGELTLDETLSEGESRPLTAEEINILEK